MPSSELRTGDVGTCLQILRDYWLWRKLLGLDGTFSEPRDVVLGFTESKESSDCKYFREECMLLKSIDLKDAWRRLLVIAGWFGS